MQPQLMMKNNDSRGMKVLLLLLVLILATIASFAQGGYTRPNTNYGTRMYRLGVDSAMSIPTGCGTPTSLKSTDLKQAMLFYDSCNAAMFVRNPKTNTWVELAAGGSVVYVDSLYTMPDSAKLFYTKNSNVYSIDLVAALSGGDSSIFEQIIDTTNIESFAIPYADTSGRFKADSALRFQPSTKTVITNNLYLYGTTASQPGKLWLKQANPSGGQRPVIYSGLIPEEFGNGAIHFSGGGGNAVMEINSGDNNDLLLHSPDGSLLFKQTDGLYRYYYLPTNTSTRKVLVTDDSGYVAWNVIDSLVSSLAAGNGIDITNGIVKLDDTLRTDTRFIAHADSGITNLELLGLGTGGLSAQGLKIYPHLGLLHLYAYEPGAGGSLFMYGNGEVTLIGKPLHLNADSIYLDKPGGGPYGPTATNMNKYKVVLMDSTTGAMTTAPLDSLGGGGGGVSAVGTFSSVGDAKGLSISSSNIIMHPATATTPGGISTGAQDIAGNKTLLGLTQLGATSVAGDKIIFYKDAGGQAAGIGFANAAPYVQNFATSSFGWSWNTGNTVQTAGTNEVMKLTGSGDLTIAGAFAGTFNLAKFPATQGEKVVLYDQAGTTGDFGIGINNATNLQIYSHPSFAITFNNSGGLNGDGVSEMMRIKNGTLSIGTTSTTSTAILDVSATLKGVLFPRTTGANITGTIVSPAAGLMLQSSDVGYKMNLYNGSYWTMDAALATALADKTATNTTTETSLISSSISGVTDLKRYHLDVGNTIVVKAIGYIKTNGSGQTVDIKLKYNSTALASTGAISLNSVAANSMFEATFYCTLRTKGNSGTMMTQGEVKYHDGTNWVYVPVLATSPVTINTFAVGAHQLDLTGTWGAASTDNVLTITNLIINQHN